MTDFPNLPDAGKFRAHGWSTEQEAALLQTRERRREVYRRIIYALRIGALGVFGEAPSDQTDGLTDDQLRTYLARFGPVSKSGPATRRGELVELGLVRPQRRHQIGPESHLPTVVKRPSDMGNAMIVWELVPGGEYVPPRPAAAERQPNAKGLAAARDLAGWEIGDPSWANSILRAYLNPEVAAAELAEQQGES